MLRVVRNLERVRFICAHRLNAHDASDCFRRASLSTLKFSYIRRHICIRSQMYRGIGIYEISFRSAFVYGGATCFAYDRIEGVTFTQQLQVIFEK